MQNIVHFDNVTLKYHAKTVIENLSFAVQEHDFFAIVGPNGCGKTTILRAILGILHNSAGKITKEASQVLGYVPQRDTLDQLFPLSSLDVVMMGRYRRMGLFSRPKPRDFRECEQALTKVDMLPYAQTQFRDLSGGQRQRVLIARALVHDPTFLVLDEPTNAMDIGSAYDIMSLLRQLWHEQKITILFVTHNLSLVADYAQRMLIISQNGNWQSGLVSEITTEATLSQFYQRPVQVISHRGKYFIRAGEKL